MDKRLIGCKVCFGEYESVLREILTDDRCRIDFPEVNGQRVMLAQYVQYVFCFYIEDTCFCARGQTLARYRIHNWEVVEIELLEGLYQKEPLQLEGISDNSIEKLQEMIEKRRINTLN